MNSSDRKTRWQHAPSRRNRTQFLKANLAPQKLRNLYHQFRTYGIQAEFHANPPTYSVPNKFITPDSIIAEGVTQMLQNQWIREIKKPLNHPGHYSKLKVVKKKSGKMRYTLACIEINKYTIKRHFKCDDLRTIKPMLQPNMYMFQIDIKDAFYSKTQQLHKDSRKYFRFAVGNNYSFKAYEFLVTPQGWSSSPRALHIMLHPVTLEANALGIQHARATDDILGMHKKQQVCNDQQRSYIKILTRHGFQINQEKLRTASQNQIWFGAKIRTNPYVIFSVPRQKQKDFKRSAKWVIQLNAQGRLTPRIAAGFTGKIRSATLYLHCAMAHTVHLIRAQNRALAATHHNWDTPFQLPLEAQAEAHFYLTHSEFKGRYVENYLIEIRQISDASNSGYGGKITTAPKSIMDKIQRAVIGFWTPSQLTLHINVKELKGSILCAMEALIPAAPFIRSLNQVFLLNQLLDNTVAISFHNKQGGNNVEMSKLIIEFHNWLLTFFLPSTIIATATYLEGSRMIQCGVDELSRLGRLGEEIRLNPRIFKILCKILQFKPTIDLFANRFNTQLPRYCSAFHDLKATHTNAMTLTWGNTVYAFPPLKMIPSTLQKIEMDKATALVILPLTPSSRWYPMMLNMVASNPIHIAQGKATFRTPNKYIQPLKQWSKWSWIGIILSHSNSKSVANWRSRTRRKWLRSSGASQPSQGIKPNGDSFTLNTSQRMVLNRLSNLSLSAALRRG